MKQPVRQVHFFVTCQTPYGWRVICACGWVEDGHRSQETAREEGNVHWWREMRDVLEHAQPAAGEG